MSDSLKGKRCVGYVRSATNSAESIQRQAESILRFAAANDMILVDQISEKQASGIGKEDFVLEVSKRKSEGHDFEVVLIASWDRLTRAGHLHASQMINALKQLGVTVITSDGETKT